MYLVYRALEGEPVPMSLPPPLVPPSKRKKASAPPAVPLLPSPPSVKESRSSHAASKTMPHPPKPAPAPAPTPAAAPVSTRATRPLTFLLRRCSLLLHHIDHDFKLGSSVCVSKEQENQTKRESKLGFGGAAAAFWVGVAESGLFFFFFCPLWQWVVLPAEKAKYDELFSKTDSDMDGLVSGPEVRDIFLKTGLPSATLARIWWVRTPKLSLGRLLFTKVPLRFRLFFRLISVFLLAGILSRWLLNFQQNYN